MKAASLDYPRPTKISALTDFYFDQQAKTSGRVDSEAPTVEMPTDEMMKRLATPELLWSGKGRPSLSVRVKIVVGVDGQVWSASPIDPPTRQSGLTAASSAMGLSFLPRMVNGKPVRISTELTLKVEDFEGSATAPVSNEQNRSTCDRSAQNFRKTGADGNVEIAKSSPRLSVSNKQIVEPPKIVHKKKSKKLA